MSKDPLYEQLRQISWRRKLTPDEEAKLITWLAAHPEAQADWEAEAGLNHALAALADAPVPSNFTSRVLDAAQLEAAGAHSPSRTGAPHWWSRWLPKAALAAVLLAAGLLSYHHTQDLKRAELAQSLTVVSQVHSLPTDVLKDFDTIAVLSSTASADEELLQVMQ